MRERVRREVMTREDLARHRKDLDRAVIGTIHSLCLQILREHPVETAIDPAAVVLSEDEAEAELLRACAESLEAAPERDSGLLALREMGVFEVRRSLPEMVRRRDEVEHAYQSMPGQSPDEWEAGLRSLMDDEARIVVESVRPLIVEWVSFLRLAHAGAGQDALTPRVAGVLALLGNPSSVGWQDLRKSVIRAKGAINLSGGSVRNWGEDLGRVKETLRSLRDLAWEFENLPQWNDYDGLVLQVLVDLRGSVRGRLRPLPAVQGQAWRPGLSRP